MVSYMKSDPKMAQQYLNFNDFDWEDSSWITNRDSSSQINKPISVYEMHLGSWMHDSIENKYIEKNGQSRSPVPAADLKPGQGY